MKLPCPQPCTDVGGCDGHGADGKAVADGKSAKHRRASRRGGVARSGGWLASVSQRTSLSGGEKRGEAAHAAEEHMRSSCVLMPSAAPPPLWCARRYTGWYTKICTTCAIRSKIRGIIKLPPIYTGGCRNHRWLHEEEEITIEGGFLEEGVRSVEGPGRGRDHVHSSRVWVMGGPTVAEL